MLRKMDKYESDGWRWHGYVERIMGVMIEARARCDNMNTKMDHV